MISYTTDNVKIKSNQVLQKSRIILMTPEINTIFNIIYIFFSNILNIDKMLNIR